MKVAIVGATGLVGSELIEVLEESRFPVSQLIPVASEKSIGKLIRFKDQEVPVVGIQQALSLRPDFALFSAGASTSKEWAPKFTSQGCYVVDNSSAWRMDPKVPLIVPEVNAHILKSNDFLIANPNCSTIQMVVALGPLQKKYKIKRLVISTYQSFTGTGVKAVKQYEAERDGNEVSEPAYPHPIFENCLPHCDIFLDNNYTKEEMKMVHETRKILGDDSLRITATAVRVPVNGGHSESINIEFENKFEIAEVYNILSNAAGIEVQDDLENNIYPMPLNARKKDEVFIGRIRRDESIENGLNIWVVSDNLRKGAATNTVQIAQFIADNVMQKKNALA